MNHIYGEIHSLFAGNQSVENILNGLSIVELQVQDVGNHVFEEQFLPYIHSCIANYTAPYTLIDNDPHKRRDYDRLHLLCQEMERYGVRRIEIMDLFPFRLIHPCGRKTTPEERAKHPLISHIIKSKHLNTVCFAVPFGMNTSLELGGLAFFSASKMAERCHSEPLV